MRSAAHVNGHPIHPMFVGFPVAYLLGSAALNLWARASGRRRLHDTARDLNTLGLASACAAAVPGIVDYFHAVPPESSARDRATKHALGNVSALALFAVAAEGDLEVGQMKLLRVGDRRIVLARTENGYRAFQDACTHKGGPLAD